jgi:hypothetical protein
VQRDQVVARIASVDVGEVDDAMQGRAGGVDEDVLGVEVAVHEHRRPARVDQPLGAGEPAVELVAQAGGEQGPAAMVGGHFAAAPVQQVHEPVPR